MTDGYAELAHAILVWSLMDREGVSWQKHQANQRLHKLAETLREVGYDVKWKEDQ